MRLLVYIKARTVEIMVSNMGAQLGQATLALVSGFLLFKRGPLWGEGKLRHGIARAA
jgi:hypothetical protein